MYLVPEVDYSLNIDKPKSRDQSYRQADPYILMPHARPCPVPIPAHCAEWGGQPLGLLSWFFLSSKNVCF